VLRLVVPPLEDGAPTRGRGLDERAARALARACSIAAIEIEPAGLFLTGGSTARACLLELGVSGLRLEHEPLPGIAAGVAIGGAWDGRPVITKAGGFGAPDAMRRLVRPRSAGRVSLPIPRSSPPVA
jgi:D-threonate/D-erythronate kinase